MPGLTSINLCPSTKKRFPSLEIPRHPFNRLNRYDEKKFNKWLEEIDDWLNENCKPETYFANRFMRFNFKNPSDALAFKIMFGN